MSRKIFNTGFITGAMGVMAAETLRSMERPKLGLVLLFFIWSLTYPIYNAIQTKINARDEEIIPKSCSTTGEQESSLESKQIRNKPLQED